jgi:pyruvate dehydrogenase E1 component beta subunit
LPAISRVEGEPGTVSKTLYVQAINRALHEEMERDPDVVNIGEDIGRLGGLYGATRGLYDRFGPERVIDTPISEAGYTGAAIGMAMEGLRPGIEMQFADFVTCAFDQTNTVAAKMHFLLGGLVKVPLVVRLPYGVNLAGGGYMSGHGPHRSPSPEAWFCNIAGLKVVMPSSPADALGLLKAAIRDDTPVMFFEQKGLYTSSGEELPEGEHMVPIGQAAVVREGSDVTVIATGATVGLTRAVAERLQAEGISIEVVDPRTLVPLDIGTLVASAVKTGRVVITHEAPLTGGYGGEIAALIAEQAFGRLRAPVRRVCGLDMPVPDGKSSALPTEQRIEEVVRSVLTA